MEAVPRDKAPKAVVELARRASSLIGRGLYGVDIKEGPNGPVVIEVNDNPNIDRGEEDAADGDLIYRDILGYLVRRIEETPREESVTARAERRVRRHYRPFSVAGIELEYPVVDAELNVISKVEEAFREIAGKSTSDVELGPVTFSNEIADHVFEIKTTLPTRSLAKSEEILVEGVRRFSDVLREKYGARLLPTGMHPWMDPREASLWKRSGQRIYESYSRIFDVHTHGWLNVHATHLNLPMGRGHEAVAMYNATVLLIPYLPALAASSLIFDGELQDSVDSRMEWILRHQAAVPETQGEILPEYIGSLSDYRRRILQPMYDAVAGKPGGDVLQHDFLNARGAVLKQGRRALEVRVIDTQECIKLDIAIAVFARAVLRFYTRRLLSGRQDLPPRQILLSDFRHTIRRGSEALVVAPHFGDLLPRDGEGRASVRSVLSALADIAEKSVRSDEASYLPLVRQMIASGSLSERIRSVLEPHRDTNDFTPTARRIYSELADCLVTNTPWRGRGFSS